MNIYQISDRYTYLKESSIKHNKDYLFSKKGKYFFDENLSIYYHSSINTLTKYNTDKKESIAIKPRQPALTPATINLFLVSSPILFSFQISFLVFH